ncbi:MAG: S8 family serine peptidase [Rubrobacteraceae bacterium]
MSGKRHVTTFMAAAVLASLVLALVFATLPGRAGAESPQGAESAGAPQPATSEGLESPPPSDDRLIVGYKEDVNEAEKGKVKKKAKVKEKRSFDEIDADVVTFEGSVKEKKKALEKQPDVEYVERDYVATAAYSPNDPQLRKKRQYEIYQQGFDKAWDKTRGVDRRTGKGIKVAVIDTGCDRRHPDLNSKIVKSYDFANRDRYADDDTGHGTFVAGIIGAETNNRSGMAAAGFRARILCAKASNNNLMYYSDAIAALRWSKKNGARVVNISFAHNQYSQAYNDMARELWNSGINIVAAAGNTGGYERAMYPAAFYGVTGVSAVDVSDRRWRYSSYGPYVDLSAMGVNVRSTTAGGGYGDWSGTSFASPTVAAQFALIKARYNPGLNARGSNFTRNRAQKTARDLGPGGRDNAYGFGRIRAGASVR